MKAKKSAEDSVQRPDLAELHGTGPTDETHGEGEHRSEDAPGGAYTGEHGATLPRKGGAAEEQEEE